MSEALFFLIYTFYMSPLFGKRKSPEKTVLILDVESGSVGGALVRLSPIEAPKLFAQQRVHLPILHTRDTSALMGKVVHAAREVLQHIAEVAARIRGHPTAGGLGSISRAAFFLAPPWVTLNLQTKVPDFLPSLAGALRAEAKGLFEHVSLSYHPFASSGLGGVRALYPEEPHVLLVLITGEVTELLLWGGGKVDGHATLPLGLHTLLRTLMSHGGLSEAEARSALHSAHLAEPLLAASAHFAGEFYVTAEELLQQNTPRAVFVVAGDMGEWFARALSNDSSVAELFPEGGTVRSLHATHISPYVLAHTPTPDTALMLEALLMEARFGI